MVPVWLGWLVWRSGSRAEAVNRIQTGRQACLRIPG
jgi:hypothetical protein